MERCKDDLEREFYIRMTRKNGWTKAVLAHQIDNQSYEKIVLNQTNFDKTLPTAVLQQAKLAVKDEYIFDFLELGEEHSEQQLEKAIVLKIGEFQPELVGKMPRIMATYNKNEMLPEPKDALNQLAKHVENLVTNSNVAALE